MAIVQAIPKLGRLWLFVPLVFACITGCGTTSTSLWNPDAPPKPTTACQVIATWQNNLAFVPDSMHGGAPMPGFVGRVYLFGAKIDFPVVAEGDLVVDLIDETYHPPRWVERWNLDGENLKRLTKKDFVGWGYTVFLPSKEARPDMTKVRLRTAFQPPQGAPIYADNVVTLSPTNGVIEKGAGKFTLPRPNPVVQPQTQGTATAQKTTFAPPITMRGDR
jgi:hypothetical protein